MRSWFPVLFLSALMAGCADEAARDTTEQDRPNVTGLALDTDRGPVEPLRARDGLDRFPGRLLDAKDRADQFERPARPPVRPLDDDETRRLLERLEPMPREVDDKLEFALRPDSRPPPRTGEVTRAEFPPDDELGLPALPVPQGPLEVVRFAPEGEVEVAGQISVTFDRPMVAVTAHDDLVGVIPLQMSPQIDGRWRWAGTRTLLFEPDAARLPMATQFELRVEAGTAAADGSVLEASVEWQFSTPPARMINAYPAGSSVILEPVVVLVFDQRVRLEAIQPHLTLRDDQGEYLPWRAASDEALAADEGAARLVENLEPGRWVAIRADSPLPPATTIEIVLEAGAPSAEGLLLTTQAQRRSFSTYGPLTVKPRHCGGMGPRCSPVDALGLEFSNPLADGQALDELVTVSPEVRGLSIEASGRSLIIRGLKQGRTRYQVTLDAALADQFGQTLGDEQVVSFDIGSLPPSVWLATETLTTADPAGAPGLDVFSTNQASLAVEIHRVDPDDWGDYLAHFRHWRGHEAGAASMPGERVHAGQVMIEARRDEPVRTRIDLSPWLVDGRHGHLIVQIRPGELMADVDEPEWHRQNVFTTWVQATDLALDAAADARTLQVWTSRLSDGSPLANAEIELSGTDGQWLSNEEGLASIELPERVERGDLPGWISVRRGSDSALLPDSTYGYSRGQWHKRDEPDALIWQVFDDRGLYRPGETVHVKGWTRRMERRPDGGLGLLPEGRHLSWSLADSRGNTLGEGETKLSALGGFDFSLALPATPNLGQARLQLGLGSDERLSNTRHIHRFRIEEFRTPEFEVRTEIEAGPFLGDEPVTVAVAAAYYAGGPLSAAPVRWQVRAEPGDYRPPDHDQWHFGFQPSWWMPWPMNEAGVSASESHEGQTDGLGRHGLDIALDFSQLPRPLAIHAAATVTDVNRQAWSATTDFLVHPGQAYIGMKTETYFVEQGTPLEVALLTVDLDGERLTSRPVVVEMVRLARFGRGPGRSEIEGETQRCEVVSDDEGYASCRFETPVGGQYRITATTRDEQGRRNASRITRWVGGGRMPAAERVEIESLLLIPDRDEYAPGDVARLLVQSPFEDAEGLLTLRRHGLAEQRRFRIEGSSITLDIPLKRDWMPNIEAHVTLLGSTARAEQADLPPRPAIAVGRHNLPISTAERVLALELTPASRALAPGESTEIALTVRDADGQPVPGAELALIVVDEAVLALTGYRVTDPLGVFYPERPAEVRDWHLRPSVRLRANEDLIESALLSGRSLDVAAGFPPPVADSAVMERAMVTDARGESGPQAAPGIDIRADFNPLAAFVPALISDDEGRVSTSVQLPDNLTRYRITAVAVSDATRYGMAESTLTARLPLMLRPSPPRFLNFGDEFEFPVVLQNQTDEVMEVSVAMATSNLDLTAGQAYRLVVPANDRVELRFPASAVSAGTARYQIAAASDDYADAARGQLPVWTPATSEAFATFGVIDDGGIRQPVRTPTEVWPQFGQLEVTTASTALQSLTDAFLYLHDYPFASSDQIASRMIATAALRDVLEAFAVADMPSPAEIDRVMAEDMARLIGLQNADGGFGLWRRGHESWPYATLHVAHALVRARLKGYPVDAGLHARTLAHVREIERHIPASYGDWARRHIVAYSLYVRALDGDHDAARARALIAEVDSLDQLSFESIGWLLNVLSRDQNSQAARAELRRFLANRVVETAGAATFASGWRDGAHLIMHSSRRADGVILEALIADQPQSDLIPKLVQGLQAHRVRGRWANTQENAFVLLALDQYFQAFEGPTPDFVARVWLGEDFAGEHAFRGRSTEQHQIDVPMQWLVDGGPEHDLVLDKDGAGRLYYRIGLRYAPRSLALASASHGFEVERRYLAVDDEDDVQQLEDGSWQIRAGARVQVEIEMVAPARRYHVALIDPLPAGLEPINPALRLSEPPPEGQSPGPPRPYRGWWWGPWYQHQNLRDERAEAFATLLPGGVYQYRYYARATTPGQFVVPPARAEEMYAPETFGRSASSRVLVIDPD
ncbi:MAG: hypothetical protein EA370_17755 [Wenzhouxiangella sp.]|nr:MAG: hypothetical protein EA370_17755 [Wenzhouxiangella sp.]